MSSTDTLQNHIEQLERMRRDFVANVSHELRTPLTVIHGYLESLAQRNTDDTLSPVFKQMLEHSSRMENIIEDLLLLSRLESEADVRDPQHAICITSLLHTLVEEAKAISSTKQHEISLHIESPVKLIAAEDELKSLFSNLIINAVKYTPAKGRIAIYWQCNNKQPTFKVIDTGIGIAKKHISRITERFYRVDKARSRESGGTGLGLAIAKHVLARYNAALTIDSELDKGSCFTCIFPPTEIPHEQ